MTVLVPAPHRLLPLQGLAAGLLAGSGVGVLARAWMRAVTTGPPEFTWSGSLFVVGAFAVVGGVAGAVVGARRRGWRGRPMTALRAAGLVSAVPLLTGAGTVLAPTLLLGAAAAGRPTWSPARRAALGAVAVVPVLAVHGQAWRDGLGAGRALAALLLCLVVYGSTALALAQSVRPVPGGTAVPRGPVVLLVAGAGAVLVGLVGAGLAGVLVGVLLLGAAAALLPAARRARTHR